MLPKPLLRVRASRDRVQPAFVDPSRPRLLERAARLLELARRGVAEGWTRGELEERIEEEIVGLGTDHRLSRGLARVLLDRCTFDADAPVDPVELRARLFAGGPAARRPGTGRPTAAERRAAVARELGLRPEQLERYLFADLRENQLIRDVRVPHERWLLDRYNVALVQGLLLHALEVEVRLERPDPARARQLFRIARFHQLMHRIQRVPGGYRLLLDGPASLLRLSTRYGLALANFFPALPLQDRPWSLEARLLWKRRRRRMELSHADGLRSHLPDTGAWISREEQELEERFRKLESGWELERGGAFIELGQEVFVPDFTFRKGGRVAHLEVLGHWRRVYLERRLAVLREHPEVILAVSRRLLGEEAAAGELDPRVLPFSRVIPPRELLRLVERFAVPRP